MQKDFPQRLKPNASKAVMSELKLRPPKKLAFFRSLFSLCCFCFGQKFGETEGKGS